METSRQGNVEIGIIYNGQVKSQADIETLKWILGKEIKKEKQDVIVIIETWRLKDEDKKAQKTSKKV